LDRDFQRLCTADQRRLDGPDREAPVRASIALVPRKPPTAPRRAPSQRRAQETVTVLLDATEIVLAERGFTGATTNHIAQTAGVSIGTLYHYFPSTEALVEAVVHRLWAREVAALEGHRAELEEGPLARAVVGIVRDLVTATASRQALVRRWYAEASHLGRLEAGLEITAGAVDIVREALVQRRARGERIRPHNLAFAADLIVKMALAMVRTGARDYAREIQSGELAAELSDMICQYLGVCSDVGVSSMDRE
jgi:AcrR family transcriptional regulator